jgi:hypothetical protein
MPPETATQSAAAPLTAAEQVLFQENVFLILMWWFRTSEVSTIPAVAVVRKSIRDWAATVDAQAVMFLDQGGTTAQVVGQMSKDLEDQAREAEREAKRIAEKAASEKGRPWAEKSGGILKAIGDLFGGAARGVKGLVKGAAGGATDFLKSLKWVLLIGVVILILYLFRNQLFGTRGAHA